MAETTAPPADRASRERDAAKPATAAAPNGVRQAQVPAHGTPKAAPAPAAENPQTPHEPKADASAIHPLMALYQAYARNAAAMMAEGTQIVGAVARARAEDRYASLAPDEGAEIAKSLGALAQSWLSDPAKAVAAQMALGNQLLGLYADHIHRLGGEAVPEAGADAPADRRFADPDWREHPWFSLLRQVYATTSRWAEALVEKAEGLDDETRQRADFYVRQLTAAMSPSNYLATNPELIRTTIAEKGENLVRGMRMLAEDIDAGGGELKIRQTDPRGFRVGVDLAVTPGKVIFRNRLIELIQYEPTTPTVLRRPVVIAPPWINKFYVLDLTPEKSFIKWLVDSGLTVFVISWVNPDERHRALDWYDYMNEGLFAAIDAARAATGEESVHLMGYCVGGTLTAAALAYMAQDGDRRVADATLLTTQVDFTHAGDLKVFADEGQIAAVEEIMARFGYLPGAKMAAAFNMLRPQDLIWPYVVETYVKGKSPKPFDLLFWNADSTRMAGANHSFYLRGCYLENRLAQGRMVIGGRTLDLKSITLPIYTLATREDHIAPARSVLRGSTLFGGPMTYVLAGSGHIAGVVNHPARRKYQHWISPAPLERFADGDLDAWLATAEERSGSWWPHWRTWLGMLAPETTAARSVGSPERPPIADAPGSYVREGA